MFLNPKSRLYRIGLILLLTHLAFSTVSAAEFDESALEEISERTSRVRDLELLTDIEVSYWTQDQVREYYAEELARLNPPEDLGRYHRTMVSFGFIDPEVDLLELYSDLYGGAIAGFYNSEDQLLVIVIQEDEELTAVLELTLAHEITHALQDQHFDLDGPVLFGEDWNDDMYMARDALIEGDATMLMYRYLEASPSFLRDYAKEVQEEGSGEDPYADFPPIIVSMLMFPYVEGLTFVQSLYAEDGYELVDQAFTEPPVTTEQVLHPEKYLEGETGEELNVIDPSEILGGDWVWTDDNVNGEYVISQMLFHEGVSQYTSAAAGWNGDRYVVAGDDEDTALVWQTSWDSDDDAEEFAEAWVEREGSRLDGDVDEDRDTWIIESDDMVQLVHLEDEYVTVIQAPDLETAESLLEAQLDEL